MLAAPMVGMPGGWELVLIVFVLILLFGAKKLPDLARGTGRALRIFKSETRGLMDDDDDDKRPADESRSEPREVTTGESTEQANPTPKPTPNPTHRPYGES